MFGRLFGSKPKDPGAPKAEPRRPKVNLAKRFTIIAETGQGSMSKVYKALDNQAGRTVCLKVQDVAKSTAAAARSAQTGRLSEGAIGQKVRHPNVVRTFDYGTSTKGEYFLTMEFIDGVSLTFIRQSRPLDLAGKLQYLIQAADALAAVHAAGFIHHDFGPKNLLINRDDQVKLIDFGLAIPNTAVFRRPGNRTGTRNYMAPELERRDTIDERIDIFSFGVTAFEFLTGRFPYNFNVHDAMAAMRLKRDADVLDIQKAAPDLPDDLCALIRKALVRLPKDRWPTMSTLADAFRELPLMAGRAE